MTYEPLYNEAKATHLSAYLLQKNDGSLYQLKLMELLYLVDRQALITLGNTVTSDNYSSMNDRLILAHTFGLMNGFFLDIQGIWDAMIQPLTGHRLSIVDNSEVSYDTLSEAEIDIANAVFAEYGHIPRFELATVIHAFPECVNPNKSSRNISYESILHASGYDNKTVESIINTLEDQKIIDSMLNEDPHCPTLSANAVA